MTSYEIVRRAIEFAGPERIPRSLPEPWGTDFHGVGVGRAPDFSPAQPGQDEWGSVWETVDASMGQVKSHPLADWSALEDYRFPDLLDDRRWEAARQKIAASDGKYILASQPSPFFERMHHLRGLERLLGDLRVERERCEELADRLLDLLIGCVHKWADAGAHGVITTDDWGVQDRLLISPALWRDFFKPRYARYIGAARERGLHFFLHSCGYIVDILGDLIECGLSVIHMDQQENMGMERLGREFGGRLCFWCPVDIQQTMIRGSVEDVARYARRLVWTLGNFNGGFIASWYGSPDAVAHTPEKIEAMSRAFVEYGVYPLKPPEEQ
jgi:hypothetical protein